MRVLLFLFLLPPLGYGEAYRAPDGLNLKPITIETTQKLALAKWDIDPEFVPYVNAFKRDYFKYRHRALTIGQIKIIRTLESGPHAGMCAKRAGYKWIGINGLESGWASYTECQRTSLIYHELGHCVLDKPHSEEGIMNPSRLEAKGCELNIDQFKKAFFEQ